MQKICPILLLAASIEGLKPLQRAGDEEIAGCRKEECAWWGEGNCSIFDVTVALKAVFTKLNTPTVLMEKNFHGREV